MVHIANAGPNQGPMFLNIDTPVGAGPGTMLETQTEDIQMVQMFLGWLGYYKRSNGLSGCSGYNDQDTIDGIKAFQRANGCTVDGRISVPRGTSFGPKSFTIVVLNDAIRREHFTCWPRIHCIPGKPCGHLVYGRLERLLGVSHSRS